VADVVVRRVVAAGLARQVLLSAFNIEAVARGRAVCEQLGPTRVAVGVGAGVGAGVGGVGGVGGGGGGEDCGLRTAWLVMKASVPLLSSAAILQRLRAHGLDALNPEGSLVDQQMVEIAARQGNGLFVWWMGVNTTSVETPANMGHLSDCGVTGFITPRVEWGLEAQAHKDGARCEWRERGAGAAGASALGSGDAEKHR
jgi:hypothetical protein